MTSCLTAVFQAASEDTNVLKTAGNFLNVLGSSWTLGVVDRPATSTRERVEYGRSGGQVVGSNILDVDEIGNIGDSGNTLLRVILD
jgi:hypothetical protein